ncbi:MAG: hypothetical protein ABF991_00115 [Liquorilactobacillus hordei]|uniref:hypothetical protein n=1 Tax=Liquorilactobacillus hordei TaxID=468911 RepID=UPI0039E771F3
MYKIEIIINTDEDFDYKNRDIEVELIKGSFHSALLRTMSRINEICNTIEGTDYIVKNVKRQLCYIMENLEDVAATHREGQESYYDYFNCGNQCGEIRIHKISRQENDIMIQIRNVTLNWN